MARQQMGTLSRASDGCPAGAKRLASRALPARRVGPPQQVHVAACTTFQHVHTGVSGVPLGSNGLYVVLMDA